eukprot:2360725-Rhodomonas_salina.5
MPTACLFTLSFPQTARVNDQNQMDGRVARGEAPFGQHKYIKLLNRTASHQYRTMDASSQSTNTREVVGLPRFAQKAARDLGAGCGTHIGRNT